jgi:pimeloyl-ACP methyl ester carboxylesterase
MPTIDLPDGRTLAYEEWGDATGPLVFRLHGTPGSRLTRHPDPALWSSHGVRVVTFDRAGFGDSTRLAGRRVVAVADDVAALADSLAADQFFVMGVSGGGPHALACAALLPERVLGCAPVCCAAHHTDAEAELLLPTNREGYLRYKQAGWTAIAEFLGPIREQLLGEPAVVVQQLFARAPPSDRAWLANPAFQAIFREATGLSLRRGVEGWADDTTALLDDEWGFDPGEIRSPVHFWHAALDNAVRLTATQRLKDSCPGAELTLWPHEGHLGSLTHEGEVISDLLARAAHQPRR